MRTVLPILLGLLLGMPGLVIAQDVAGDDDDSAGAVDEPTISELMAVAYAAKRSEDWGRAKAYLEAAALAGADEHEIALELGYVAMLAEAPDEAVAQFRIAARSDDPKIADKAIVQLAAMGVELAEEQDETEGAEPTAEAEEPKTGPVDEPKAEEPKTGPAAKAKKPQFPLKARPVMKRAWRLKKSHDFDGARAAFAEAGELGVVPVHIAQELAWVALAELELALEEERTEDAATAAELARTHLLEVLELGGDVADTSVQLGYVALQREDPDEARARFEDALDAGADSETIALQLAYVLLQQELPEQARSRFEEALEHGADARVAAKALGFLAVEREDYGEARVRFEQALEDGAEPKELALPLARMLIRLGEFDDAGHWIDAAEVAEVDPAEVAVARGSLALGRLAAVRASEPDADAEQEEKDTWAAQERAALTAARERLAAALDAGADPKTAALQLGYLAVDANDFEDAHARFEQARLGGADQQTIALAEGYLASRETDYRTALDRFEQARKGPNEEIAEQAAGELAPTWIALALQHLALGRAHAKEKRHDEAEDELDQAEDLLNEAEDAGADWQTVELYRAYVDSAAGRVWAARAHLREVRRGDEEALQDQAKGELKMLPRMLWGDLYADVFAWYRFVPTTSGNLVPTLRLRGYLHPIPYVDLDFYLYFQISRDIASRAEGPLGYPEIYADNTAMLGVGAQFRFWKKRVGLFAQAGPVFKLVDDGANRVAFDFRAGAFFAIECEKCRPESAGKGARFEIEPCTDVYADLIYVSRFNHNLFFFARGRFALGYLVTGPISWAPVIETRFLKDIRNDYYNNLVDVGLAHRWRLLEPIGVDFLFGIHTGTYFGLQNIDPAPSTLGYVELRWQLSTYISF